MVKVPWDLFHPCFLESARVLLRFRQPHFFFWRGSPRPFNLGPLILLKQTFRSACIAIDPCVQNPSWKSRCVRRKYQLLLIYILRNISIFASYGGNWGLCLSHTQTDRHHDPANKHAYRDILCLQRSYRVEDVENMILRGRYTLCLIWYYVEDMIDAKEITPSKNKPWWI